MDKYKIIGNHPVAGVAPGKTVELDLAEANIAALVKAGHVAPARQKKNSSNQSGGPFTDYVNEKIDEHLESAIVGKQGGAAFRGIAADELKGDD